VDCLFVEFEPGKESLIDKTDPKEQVWKIAQAAHELKLPIIFVDEYKKAYILDYRRHYTDKEEAYNVYVRNKGMANEIEKAFASGRCHTGIYLVGKGHQFSSWRNFRITSLQEFLKQSGRSSVSLNIVKMSFDDSNSDSSPKKDEFSAIKDSCRPPLPGRLSAPAGFLHEPMAAKVRLFDYGGFVNDFDATIFR
jgi:hypothetical protein